MAITGEGIYIGAAEVLEDITYVTYLEAQLLRWVNDAQRAVCLVRPDAASKIQNVAIAANTARQVLPANVARLGGLLRNMGADGLTGGRAITGPTPREPMDASDPLWMTRTGGYVRGYVYSEETPFDYYIYPVIASSWFLEAKLFLVPTDLVIKTNAISLSDMYAPAMREWLLYSCFARDSERTPNYVRAGRHFSNFFQLLGVKTRADLAVSPKVLEFDQQLQGNAR